MIEDIYRDTKEELEGAIPGLKITSLDLQRVGDITYLVYISYKYNNKTDSLILPKNKDITMADIIKVLKIKLD